MVTDSGLSGEVDLNNAPEALTYLSLYLNQLTGLLDLTRLPVGLEKLILNHNLFYGTPCLRYLPRKLQTLSLDTNHLWGTVSFEKVRARVMVNLSHNHLENRDLGWGKQQGKHCVSYQKNITECGFCASLMREVEKGITELAELPPSWEEIVKYGGES